MPYTPYNKLTWVNGSSATPVSGPRLAHMETQYDEAMDDVEASIGDDTTPIGAALSSTIVSVGDPVFARLSRVLEGTTLYVYGDSQGKNPSQNADAGTQFSDRLNIRHHFRAYDNRAVAGTDMTQIAAAVNSSWVANTRGLVLLCSGIGNTSTNYGADGQPTGARAFRTIMALLNARAKFSAGSSTFAFDASWAGGASSTANAIFDFGVNGDACDLIVTTSTGSGGTLVVRNGSTVVATINTGGYEAVFPGAFRISGLGAGDHTLRATLTTGSVAVSGLAIPSPSPAQVVWVTVEPARSNVAQRQTYVDACAAVLADFPNVIHITPGDGWVPTTHIGGEDSLHLNDEGNAFMADCVESVLATELAVFQQGLNRLASTGAAPAYTGPIPDPLFTVTTYASDDFNRADGALGTTSVGAKTWTSDKIQIVSNQARGVTGALTAGEKAWIDDSQSNGVIRGTLGLTGSNVGLFFRANGSNAGYYFMYSGSATAWRIGTHASSFVPIQTAATSPTPTVGTRMEVRLSGTSIICLVDDVEVFNITDATYSGTRHGIIGAGVGSTSFDSWAHTDA